MCRSSNDGYSPLHSCSFPSRFPRRGAPFLLLAILVLVGAIALFHIPRPAHASGGDVYVHDYGATVNNPNMPAGQDIQNAINAAITGGASRVIFDAGTYYLDQAFPTLTISNTSNLTLVGQVDSSGRPTTVFQQQTSYPTWSGTDTIDLENTSNIIIQNIAVDETTHVFTLAKVIAVGSNSITMQVQPGYGVFANETFGSGNYLDPFDMDTLKPYGRGVKIPSGIATQLVSGTTDELSLQASTLPGGLHTGEYVTWFWQLNCELCSGLVGHWNNNLLIDNYDVRGVGNGAAEFIGGDNLTIRRLRISSSISDIRPTGGGGPYIGDYSGNILFENWSLQGLRDDAYEVANDMLYVTNVTNATTISVGGRGFDGESHWFSGDKVDFYKDWTTWTPTYVATLQSTSNGSLTFTQALPSWVQNNTFLDFEKYTPSLVRVRNNDFENSSGGYVTKVPTLFENNIVAGTALISLYASTTSFQEGPTPQNIEVKNNVFWGNGGTGVYPRLVVNSGVPIGTPFHNINVHDNYLFNGSNIYFNDTDSANVTNNQFYPTVQVNRDSSSTPNYSQSGNTVLTPLSGNLVSNGGFETGNLNGWTVKQGTALVVNSHAHSGTYALDLPSGVNEVATTINGLQPNTLYEASAYAESPGGGYVSLKAYNYGEGIGNLTGLTSTTSYGNGSLTFKTGPTATSANLSLLKQDSTGDSYVDDVQLVEMPGSQDTPTPPPAVGGPTGFTFCANETGTCSFSGTAQVAYGANGQFFYKTLTNGTACNNNIFGDPAYGYSKACYYVLTNSNGPFGFTFCANENGTCSFGGVAEVAYGANGQFYYKNFTNGTGCNNTIFGGDPDYGYTKACYYQSAS